MRIDHLDNIDIDTENPQSEFILRAFRNLHSGLVYLYTLVRNTERELANGSKPDIRSFLRGESTSSGGISHNVVECAFHWYGVSVCNYIRLLGSLSEFDGIESDPDPITNKLRTRKESVDRYIDRIAPKVRPFRDKIGAHLAAADYFKRDSLAEEFASIMSPQICWQRGRFLTPVFHIFDEATSDADEQKRLGDSTSLIQWSLTRLHEELQLRFWPDAPTSLACTEDYEPIIL